MNQPTSGFGQCTSLPAAVRANRPNESVGEPLQPPLAYQLFSFLDRVLVWIPRDRKPGGLAIALFLLRITILPWLFALGPFVLAAIVSPTVLAAFRQHGPRSPAAGLAAVVLIFGSIALVEELGRYGFVRNAERPFRALALFAVLTSLILTAIFHDHPSTMIWLIGTEVATSAVLYCGMLHQKSFGLLVTVNVICHTALFLVPHSLNAIK
jgi:hypothetical protein